MMDLLKDTMEGKLGGAKFYTNSWPNFSAIVCQWEYPRVSDVSNSLEKKVFTKNYYYDDNI